MASNNYNPYNYPNYQQSSAQQYSAYQTAPAANTIPQPSRQQYQQAPPPATTQPTDYMSYPAQSYNNQTNTYGSGGQDNTWNGSNYGGNRETTSRAAEVLRNMSSTTYSSNTTGAVSQPGFTATNTASVNAPHYSTASPAQHAPQSQVPHANHSSYGQSQARPRSVNTSRSQSTSSNRGITSPAMAAGYPAQRTQVIYNQQQQRSASPAQQQYNQNNSTPVDTARTAAMNAATQYNDYSHRQLPSVDASRTQNNPVPASYNYADTQATAPMASQCTASANVSEQYSQNTVTVDPMAVYDPWPEYQRKQEALKAQKAIEDAARAEEERKAAEIRKEDERIQEEQRRKDEEEENAKQASQAKSRKGQSSKKTQKQPATAYEAASASSAAGDQEASAAEALESEIRAMMAKMRELNGKDPALLARIWEEERRAKGPNKSPTVQSKPTPQATAAQPVHGHIPQAANQQKKAAPKETSHSSAAVRTPAQTAISAVQASVAQPQAQAVAVSTGRPAGHTIWPPEKKAQLANTAATYLNGHNPSNPITSQRILDMLDSNPSYIELCEQLEGMALKLDRAAFAKNLLTAVPDVNSASRSQTQAQPRQVGTGVVAAQMNGNAAQRLHIAPTSAAKRHVATPMAPTPGYTPAAQTPMDDSFPSFPDDDMAATPMPVPVAEMVPIRPELKPPANKEEAARKRNFNDLIDLTLLDEEEDLPPPKKQNTGSMYSYESPSATFDDAMDVDEGNTPVNNFPTPVNNFPTPVNKFSSPANNFPVAAQIPSKAVQPVVEHVMPPSHLLASDMTPHSIVQPLDKKKALRRNAYNIKTIARDVLLACGRHPEERQLNAHLEILRTSFLNQVTTDSDLSTLRWDILDRGQPPKGYYKDGSQAQAEDADDEDDSDDEDRNAARPGVRAPPIGSDVATDARAQALPAATNPFKIKRPGRPPRHSYPENIGIGNPALQTPRKGPKPANMSASAGPSSRAASVGYSAFRSATEYGPDGQPLPKKRGRPVGWRKAIHGSAAAQARPGANGHPGPVSGTSTNFNRFVPSQPSTLRNVRTGDDAPIMISSRSPSVSNKAPRYQSFKCKWQNCKAELHNLDTLRKHVQKVHRKETLRGTLECFWGDCGREVTNVDPATNMRFEKHTLFSFTDEEKWREHLELRHFGPLAWELGDGPASGVSDGHDSEAYLSDAQGRRVTPRVTAEPSRLSGGTPTFNSSPAPRGRGRPPKVKPDAKPTPEQEARDTQDRLVAQKKRVGGPGMDRGGATFVNEKRRKGFSDDDQTEEEFVDAEG